MKGPFLLAVISVCLLSPCEAGRWWGWWRQPRTVTYTVRNVLTEPTFEIKQEVEVPRWGRVPFINIMERAAHEDKRFRFSVDFFDLKLGYSVTTINSLKADFIRDQTFWALLGEQNGFLEKGISSYRPARGEHIIFNFTRGDHVDT